MDNGTENRGELVDGVDYYLDPDGMLVFTEAYHLKRGFCCKHGCRHCPYGTAIDDDSKAPT